MRRSGETIPRATVHEPCGHGTLCALPITVSHIATNASDRAAITQRAA